MKNLRLFSTIGLIIIVMSILLRFEMVIKTVESMFGNFSLELALGITK